MKVKEYLERLTPGTDVTFIKARARKDANTPNYHTEYQTTPINPVWVWKDGMIMDYIILNDKQPPIDWLSGANWGFAFKRGNLKSLLVVSEDDFKLLFPSEAQRESMEKFIEAKINTRKENCYGR